LCKIYDKTTVNCKFIFFKIKDKNNIAVNLNSLKSKIKTILH